MIWKIRDTLRGFRLAGAELDALFPRDLIEIAVVQHENDESGIRPFLPVFGDGDQHVEPVHLHGTISHARDDGPLRIGHLGRERVRSARAQ